MVFDEMSKRSKELPESFQTLEESSELQTGMDQGS